MTENTDHSLAEIEPTKPIRVSPEVVETILDLDEVLSSAKLIERTATICLSGDLVAEYESVMTELGTLIDANGQVLGNSGEQELYSARAARAQALNDRAEELLEGQRAAQRTIRFRGMDEDTFAAFEKTHRFDNGQPKEPRKYVNLLIATCAIAPTLTEAEVAKMRKALVRPQVNLLFETAYEACTVGGLDVPKSLPFSLAPKPQG